MHTQIWDKYLPVIKILLKKSANCAQTLNLNIQDFERAGLARKTGNKFHLHFQNGRADNAINASPLAKDFASTLLGDDTVKSLFMGGEYELSLNNKYQLGIKCLHKAEAEEKEPATADQGPN
ncbi:hypothetical protein [Flavisolibacter tropicus]|uniref:Uncharacterized protein n=1 Tax=Flavisolibacter tropicus TaxID=1492898 RepID=A0A172TWT4_9BACT|nr:hypothetical protein [Flavisolibacter tropicus]ANE51549.1 hypothetical protein SY85_14580 [Flavisolibacter tropicus]